MNKVAIIAGELSGDKIGASLVRILSQKYNIELFGVGGQELSDLGLKSLFPYEELSIIGIWSILKNIKKLNIRLNFTVKAIVDYNPDILIIIDSPEFTHRVAKRVNKSLPNLPIINLVPPLVWVWRRYRARYMQDYITHILCIYPFEPRVFRELNGPNCTYIGNPLFNKITQIREIKDQELLDRLVPKTILFMPGSRQSEVEKLLPTAVNSFKKILTQGYNIKIKIPTFTKFSSAIKRQFQDQNLDFEIIVDETEKVKNFYQSDVALVASGSATLELCAAKLPMVVIYKLNFLNVILALLMGLNKSYISLPNLILNRKLVPELVQYKCTSENISQCIRELLDDVGKRKYQMDGFDEIHSKMRAFSSDKELHNLFCNYLS